MPDEWECVSMSETSPMVKWWTKMWIDSLHCCTSINQNITVMTVTIFKNQAIRLEFRLLSAQKCILKWEMVSGIKLNSSASGIAKFIFVPTWNLRNLWMRLVSTTSVWRHGIALRSQTHTETHKVQLVILSAQSRPNFLIQKVISDIKTRGTEFQ